MSADSLQELFRECFQKNLEMISKEPEEDTLNRLFDGSLTYKVFEAGKVNVTTGKIEIGDPICYMNTKYACKLEKTVPMGLYPVLISVLEHPVFGRRYLAAKLDITGKTPVRYELAMPEGYTIEDKGKPGVLAMFGVDAGMACICDQAASRAYSEFLETWHKEHPEGNHYDDFLAGLLADYARRFPDYQNSRGDYMEWYLPETGHNLVMFDSGYGDGAYSGYWGIDEGGQAACLVIRFIDPESLNVSLPEPRKQKKFYKKPEEIKPLIEKHDFCIASDKIMVEGSRVGYLYHGAPDPDHEEDSGWVFYEGSEDEEYTNNSENFGLYSLNTVANYDPDVIPLLDAPVGMAFFRGTDGKFYVDRGSVEPEK